MTKSPAIRFILAALLLGAPVFFHPESGRTQSGGLALPPGELGELRGGAGLISWSGGYVEAEGTGAIAGDEPTAGIARLKAERAAKADALRNLLETTKGVRVTGETVVENFMTRSDTIRTQVEGLVKGALEVEGSKKFDGQIATVRLRMPLWGEVAATLYGAPGLWELQGPTPAPIQAAPPAPLPGPSPEGLPKGIRGFLWRVRGVWRLATLWSVSQAYAAVEESAGQAAPQAPTPSKETHQELLKTGIILDLTGTPAKPELFPRIFEASTGNAIVDAKAAGQGRASLGVMGYASSVEAAKTQRARVGDDPLIIKALNAYAGTNEGLKIDLASGMTMETAQRAVKNPSDVLKQGITVAYRFTW